MKVKFYRKNTTKYNRNRKLFFQEVPVESRYFWNVFSRWRRAVIKTEIGPGNTNIRQNTNSLPDELSSLKEIPLRISSSNANIKAKDWEYFPKSGQTWTELWTCMIFTQNNSHNLGLKLGYPTPLCPTFAKLYFRCYVSKSPIGNQKSAISMEGNPIWTVSKSGIGLRSHIKEYVLIKQRQNRDSVKLNKNIRNAGIKTDFSTDHTFIFQHFITWHPHKQ